jgi:hypothetical protein
MKIYILFSAVVIYFTYYLLTNKKRKLRKKVKRKLKEEQSTDDSNGFWNMIDGISKGKELYKKLIVRVHPDNPKNINFSEEKKLELTSLSQRITQAKRNYKELKLLEIEVEKFYSDQN